MKENIKPSETNPVNLDCATWEEPQITDYEPAKVAQGGIQPLASFENVNYKRSIS